MLKAFTSTPCSTSSLMASGEVETIAVVVRSFSVSVGSAPRSSSNLHDRKVVGFCGADQRRCSVAQ